jgi:hypothetical protein
VWVLTGVKRFWLYGTVSLGQVESEMTSNLHWNFFLAVEEDVLRLARFIEFTPGNFSCYSIELARILMIATQEVDVLLKQVCAKHGDPAAKEQGYRDFFLKHYTYQGIQAVEIVLYRFDLTFVPFQQWAEKKTPDWWTGNNKVKHERHASFERASLQNALNAFCALYVANIYQAEECGDLANNLPGSRLLKPKVWWQSELFGADGEIHRLPDFDPRKVSHLMHPTRIKPPKK